MSRPIVPVPGFDRSVAALGEAPEVHEVVRALIAHAVRHPYGAPKIPGLEARILKSRSYGRYPAIRLLYRVEGETVYLYEVGFYDPLDD